MSAARLYINMWTLKPCTKAGKPLAPPTPPAVLAERARSGAALRKAKDLAEKFGIEIEKEGPGAYWVTHDDFTDTGEDPLEGSHFCSDGAEVLAAVQTYVDTITKIASAAA